MVSRRFIHGLIFFLAASAAHSRAWAVPERAIEPLLAERWQASAEVLLADENQQSDPVTRLLLGYVSLASNHTSEAMAMFASVQDLEGLRRWRTWTERFARANSGNRLAALLSIDAQARLGEVTAATQAMQTLLKKEPRFALAYDLAGALAILRDDKVSAREAFKTATELDPQLADAWISRGSLEAIARTPLDMPQLGNVRSADVLAFFDSALALDPASAPARLGRGVILYGLGRFTEAADVFADAERVAPWLGLAAYDGMQSELTVMRRYALQLASREKGAGIDLQAQIDQESQLLDERARESNAHLMDTVTRAGNPPAALDPKLLDTGSESQLQALVSTYGLRTIELANAARLDGNSADLFRRNSEIQDNTERLSILKNTWEATYNLALAQPLLQAANDVKNFGRSDPELAAELAVLRLTWTVSGLVAGRIYDDKQWVGRIGVSRLSSVGTAVSTAAVQGTDIARAARTAAGVPLRPSELASILRAVLSRDYDLVGRQEDAAMSVARSARNNIQNARLMSSWSETTNKVDAASPKAILAPSDYARDASGQAAFINAVSQSVRSSSVVLVPQDRTQSLLLQQELNRQGLVTQTAQTPQGGIDLAKRIGASWVIGADGHWADPPIERPSRLLLKPPDDQSIRGGGPPPPPPLRNGGGPPPPPPQPSRNGGVSQPPPPPGASSFGPENWNGFQRFTSPPPPSMPGGVRTFTDALIDDGRWPVHVPLTLCLPVALTAGTGQ